jgi:pilus assembly protein CpaE
MATQLIPIVVLSTDLDNFNELRAALAADSRVKLLSGGNDAEQLYDEVARLKPAAAIISLGGSNAEQAIRLIQRLKVECPQIGVVSAARETSADLILQSLRAGAQEFLRVPISTDELRTVLDRIAEFCARQAEAAKKTGRMTAVFSNKGGCGTSFIAANLAAASSARTVLVDLNLESGDLPLFFGSNPKNSIADLAVRKGRLDAQIISAFVTPYSANLDLLAAPKEVDPIDKIKPEHVFEVLQRLRESYEYVVLDLQHTFDAITLAALEQSDDIVLVLTLDLLAIRSAKRALQIFDRAGYPRTKVRVVVNRWSKQLDLDIHQVEEILGEPVAGSLPSDYQTVVNSINMGKPLVKSDARSKIAREIERVAHALSADTSRAAEPKTKRSWSFFLKRQSAEKE